MRAMKMKQGREGSPPGLRLGGCSLKHHGPCSGRAGPGRERETPRASCGQKPILGGGALRRGETTSLLVLTPTPLRPDEVLWSRGILGGHQPRGFDCHRSSLWDLTP